MKRSEGPRPAGDLLLAAVVLGGLLMTARLTRSPLDDPDRLGILVLGALPVPAPAVTGGHPSTR